MKAEHAAEMNRLSRMTREQREEEMVRDMLGPLFGGLFLQPDEPHPAIDGMEGEE